MATIIPINSSNRGAARKLLTTWHDSRKVRILRLGKLRELLFRAVNEGLITVEGVNRALGKKTEQKNDVQGTGEGHDENDNSGENDESTGDNSGTGSQSNGGSREANQAFKDGYDDASAGMAKDAAGRDDDNHYQDGYEQATRDEQSERESSESDDERDDQESGSEQESESEGEQEEEEQSNCETCGADAEAQQSAKENKSTRPACADCGAYAETDESGMIYPREFDVVYTWVKAGVPVALVGPTGSGKSVLAAMIGDALELDNYGCGAMLSKYDLIGFVDAGGAYHGTPLFDAVSKGGLFTFDEMDASAPDATVSFNAITDGQKAFTFPCGSIIKHDALRVIACLNTYGYGATADYVGRNKLDAASMNRYVKVYIDYDERVELKIADKNIVTRAQNLRSACTALGIRHIVSTRTVALAQKGRNAGQSNAIIDRDLMFAGLDDDIVTQLKTAMEAL